MTGHNMRGISQDGCIWVVCLGLASLAAGGASPVPISPRWVDATALRPSILGATGTAGSGTTVVLCVLPLPQPNYLAQVPSTYCPLAGCTSLAHISSTRAGPVACGTRVVALGGISAGGALGAGRRSGPEAVAGAGRGRKAPPPPGVGCPRAREKSLSCGALSHLAGYPFLYYLRGDPKDGAPEDQHRTAPNAHLTAPWPMGLG